MSTEPDNAGRMQGGQFAPGTSGNPAGKKAGTRHKATQAALALLSGEVDGTDTQGGEKTFDEPERVSRMRPREAVGWRAPKRRPCAP